MARLNWAAGVGLGGTKIQIIQVNAFGTIGEKVKIPTDVKGGPKAVERQIADAVKGLEEKIGCPPAAIGVGVAGQIEAETCEVIFAPNLKWHNISFQRDLKRALGVPVVVTNDVRAATWGEWLHGAGKGTTNLLCVFVGTGVGGGIVSHGKMIAGKNNTAGEIGHMTVSIGGPKCTCGNEGCMEATAGGWAIARQGQEAVSNHPDKGKKILELAGGEVNEIKGRHVMEAAESGDELAKEIVNAVVEALAAGVSSLVNAISPERIIFRGGVIEGSPHLVEKVEKKIFDRSLEAATQGVEIGLAKLHNEAGAIGAGALAIRLFVK